MGGRRGVERKGVPTKPAKHQVIRVTPKQIGPVKNHGSWWAVPDEKFAAAVATRGEDSWGEFKDKQLTTAANDGRVDPAPKLREFAPKP